MSDTVIKVVGLSKKYVLQHDERERYTALRDVMTAGAINLGKKLLSPLTHNRSPVPSAKEDFYALRDVDFEVKQGERVGMIGRNGAGKSTLLKVLSRITEPTTGRVEITGRVASLLEVGTGFHPELTGRENIYLNGAILGMTRVEIRKKFDEIVDFAEIEKFLDTPVKRYSSGMYVRLAFAVAAHLEPEILIVDEVLAVGDAQFQKKCLGKMEEVGRDGRTILFVSHNMSAIQKLCTRCLVVKAGKLMLDDIPVKAVATYLQEYSPGTVFQRSRRPSGKPAIMTARLKDSEQDLAEAVVLHLGIESDSNKSVSIDVRLTDGSGVPVGFGSIGTFDDELWKIHRGMQTITISFPVGQLAVGKYLVSVDLTKPDHLYFDRLENCLSFEVTRPPSASARRVLHQSWGYGSVQLPLTVAGCSPSGDSECCQN